MKKGLTHSAMYERNAAIVEAYAEGMSIPDIATTYDLSEIQTAKVLTKSNVEVYWVRNSDKNGAHEENWSKQKKNWPRSMRFYDATEIEPPYTFLRGVRPRDDISGCGNSSAMVLDSVKWKY